MNPASEIYNPDGVPHGGDIITINGVDYIAEVNTPSYPTTRLDLPDELSQTRDRPAVLLAMRPTGNLTIQIPSEDTAIPVNGNTFQFNFGEGVETCVIENRSPVREMGKYRVVTGGYFIQ